MKPLRSVFVCCLSAALMAACSSSGDPNEPTDEKTDDGAEALANTGGGTGIGAACTACGCYYHWRRVGDRHILTCSCPVDKQACFDCKYSGNCKATGVFQNGGVIINSVGTSPGVKAP